MIGVPVGIRQANAFAAVTNAEALGINTSSCVHWYSFPAHCALVIARRQLNLVRQPFLVMGTAGRNGGTLSSIQAHIPEANGPETSVYR